ncbi:MAG: hypothetical protein KAJ92_03855 [Gammaproteobacteria bacterium]|nr:hypothetical protein [Gammaproteobacteria bacterium]MCK5262791.1 hypothetical protein [Gammaproteobacteria bacterium]
MKETKTKQLRKGFILIKTLGVNGTIKCKQLFSAQVLPQSKKYTILGAKVYNEKLAPNIYKGSKLVGQELLKIHKKQNWLKRFAVTMLDNSAGLSMAMISAKLVESVVEVSEFSNLWGLLATRPVVSEATYEVLSFIVEFVVALLAFTLTEHYRDEYRERKKSSSI